MTQRAGARRRVRYEPEPPVPLRASHRAGPPGLHTAGCGYSRHSIRPVTRILLTAPTSPSKPRIVSTASRGCCLHGYLPPAVASPRGAAPVPPPRKPHPDIGCRRDAGGIRWGRSVMRPLGSRSRPRSSRTPVRRPVAPAGQDLEHRVRRGIRRSGPHAFRTDRARFGRLHRPGSVRPVARAGDGAPRSAAVHGPSIHAP
jgi:hypothetical protein